jgi:WhiB family redox-sensing transcriptional regulator
VTNGVLYAWKKEADVPALLGPAACVGADPELFFADSGGPPAVLEVARAKDYCAGCPVQLECGEWALGRNVHGIWGGMTQAERSENPSPSRRAGIGRLRSGRPTAGAAAGTR